MDPGSVDEIEQAVVRGDLEETSSFDGKRELPASTKKGNASAAVDVAAMSTAGSTILYGVGEDASERLTVRNPIILAGAGDRIAQIVETSIEEVPHIDFKPYALPEDPTVGYLLVIVPPSPRSPHQVTVGDDRRFCGRGAKGNRRLSEHEVALLYAKRQQREVNLARRLQEVVESTPYAPEGPDDGSVYAFAQPVPPDHGLWDAAVAAVGGVHALQQRLARAARGIVATVEFDPSFRESVHWHRLGADAWRMSSQAEDPRYADFVTYVVNVTFNIDGQAVLFSGNAARCIDGENGRKYLFERVIAGNLATFFAAVGALFDEAGYFAAVDLGVAVTNLEGAASAGRQENAKGIVRWSQVPKYNAATYRRTRRLTAASELHDAEGVALALVGRLFATTTGRDDYNPFQ